MPSEPSPEIRDWTLTLKKKVSCLFLGADPQAILPFLLHQSCDLRERRWEKEAIWKALEQSQDLPSQLYYSYFSLCRCSARDTSESNKALITTQWSEACCDILSADLPSAPAVTGCIHNTGGVGTVLRCQCVNSVNMNEQHASLSPSLWWETGSNRSWCKFFYFQIHNNWLTLYES